MQVNDIVLGLTGAATWTKLQWQAYRPATINYLVNNNSLIKHNRQLNTPNLQ